MIALPVWSIIVAIPVLVAAIFIRNRRRAIFAAGLCMIALAGGAVRYQSSIQLADNTSLQYFNDSGAVLVQGMVSSAPETRGASTSFTFTANKVATDNCTMEVSGKTLVRQPFYRQFKYGEVLQLKGKLETAPVFDDFDYRNYLANQGIYSVMNFPAATVMDSGRGFWPLAWIYSLRDQLARSLSICIAGPQGSLAQAILLGLRGNIPQDITQSFYKTGTTHLIAISGLNLTILLGMILPLTLRIFGRRNRIYIWLSLAVIWSYTCLSGMPPTVVRAAIMASMFLLAELLGRQRNAIATMSFAAAIMVLAEPGVLWDTSFQLSYLSMLGLILISPQLIRFSISTTPRGVHTYLDSIKNIITAGFSVTLAAILATLPVTAVNFHSFSLVGAPATLFAMPSFPAIIGTSLLTAFAGLIWQPLGILFGWITWLFLSYFLLVVDVFSAIPIAYVQRLSIQPWQVILYYLLLGAGFLAFKNWTLISHLLRKLFTRISAALSNPVNAALRRFVYILLPLLLIANILAWIAYIQLPDGKLHVSVLDVGQGESILIVIPDGQKIVIDTGPDPAAASTAIGARLPYWDRSIDMLILTQMQSDHTSGSIDLLNRYDVRQIVLPHAQINSSFSKILSDTLKHASSKIRYVSAGQQINLGRNAFLTVLNPPLQRLTSTSDDINNNSVVIRVVWDRVSFLLASDIGMEAERYMIAQRVDLRSSVLKVAHHGSKNSNCDAFLAIVSPSAAVISAGAGNRFGHPHRETMDKLTDKVGVDNIFLTAVHGTVEFITDGKSLWYRCEHPAQRGNQASN